MIIVVIMSRCWGWGLGLYYDKYRVTASTNCIGVCIIISGNYEFGFERIRSYLSLFVARVGSGDPVAREADIRVQL
jgi:hypothetical protein